MKTLSLIFLSTIASLAMAADKAAAKPAAPGPTPTMLSTPDVPVDPRFVHAEYAQKFPHITLEEAQKLQAEKDVVFVDGRAMVEWELSHIPNSVPIPLGEFDKRYASAKKKLQKARILVSYCHGEGCRLSDLLAQKLVDKGHHNVAVFWGGFPAWDGAKLALTDKKGKAIVRPAAVSGTAK